MPYAIRDIVSDIPIDDLFAIADIVSIAVTPANPNVANAGTQQMVATATYDDGHTGIVTSSVVWASASTNRATVSASGLVTGVSAGTSVVSASLGGKTGSTTVTCTG